jgi:tRNA threonylcarbamoyladenosine biosynthesis protein TsaE
VAEPIAAPLTERRLVCHSADATEALAAAVGAFLAPGDVVALRGELGAGKTCFVRGAARALGVAGPVASPTYTLMHAYEGRLPVYHLDAWMQGRGEAFLEDGGAEWLRADGVAFVEWAERVAAWLPPARLEVLLEHAGPERRFVRLAVSGLSSDASPTARSTADRLSRGVRGLALPPEVEPAA